MSNSTKVFYAGWNIPGYMPEAEPVTFYTIDEAGAYIEEEINRYIEEIHETLTEEQLEEAQSMAGDFGLGSCDGGKVGNYWFFVSEGEKTPENELEALAAFLDISPDDLTQESYDCYCMAVFSDGAEYAIGTDEEAEEAAKLYILESIWAFNSSFLSGYTGLPEEIFSCLQDKCEEANNTFIDLIETHGGIDDFIQQAISADGRGHFLASYDGHEHQLGDYFIYRIN